jgi:hypothetical protein
MSRAPGWFDRALAPSASPSAPSSDGRARLASWVLVAIVIALAVWRVALVRVGPDPDSDAYGHHGIARQILVDPRDLSVHWVWLPLFHYAQSLLIVLGATMETVRWINVALWAAVPLVLFRFMGGAKESAPFVAAIVCALAPIGMQMGTTAQPEPVFCLVVLLGVAAIERARFIAAAALFASAVMLRYEAWAGVAGIAAVLGVDAIVARTRSHETRYASRAWLSVAAPVLAILAWGALRRAHEGTWFSFLRETHQFATDATKADTSLGAVLARVSADATYYGVHVAKRVLGPAVWLAPFGVVRTWKKQGPIFVLVFGGCLAFVTLTWITRSSLGLDRHFVVAIPLYAAFIANGAVQIAELAARFASRWATAARVAITTVLSCAAIASVWLVLDGWMHDWRGALEHGWPDREAVGAYLRTLPPSTTIFCDDATIEIISGIDRHRFDRHWIDAPDGADRVEEAGAHGSVYVATWMRKTRALRERGATIVFRSPGATGEDGLVVLRVGG